MAKMATREAYGKALAKLIVEDEKIFVLDADLSKSTKTADAQAANPSRHFNMGIAECNMMGVAAGIATGGNTVFASSFAMFAAGRAFEIVRNSICYPKLNVKICATHAGITLGEDGASHQAIEDIALMRSIPNMTVIQPCDDIETMQAIKAVAKYKGPVYVRLGRSAVETANSEDYVFEIGKGVVLRKGVKVAVVATGILVQEALKAADILKEEGVLVTVVNIHTIKPIDKNLLIDLAKTHDVLLTCEEHNVLGGLGSAVAEVVSQHHPVKISMLGIEDTFGESGTPAALMEKYGITYKHVLERIRKL
ncbi:MAG: transketolase [Firmicutes bacterium HGW-Firmicutes-20]|jgi:transketolase|nr:MAG: transketolase [Firmicutes bacterium HGW-Firmicutes-20]PKM90334.1 MAG: transketolase [Firmicutes bacterium HGW-Firmicutes-10]